ncbi:MAG: hypothetical protein JWM19_6240 [Actinomycetia bacterium]|nr:hypothetical protein [Actinomycetes bacterium]
MKQYLLGVHSDESGPMSDEQMGQLRDRGGDPGPPLR